MRRRVMTLCVLFCLIWSVLPVAAQGPTPEQDKEAEKKVAPEVRALVGKGGRAEFLVVLTEQADLRNAESLPNRAAKAQFVYQRLRETATRTQDKIVTEVEALGGEARRFVLVNALLVTGDAKLVDRLAQRKDVGSLLPNPAIQGIRSTPDAPTAQVGTPWGINRVKAPQVWSQYTRGAGIVVASADTGVDWTHPGLKPKYRGWDGVTADHSYSWHDAIENQATPLDDNGHGTHTTGTMLGGEGANNVGVAPDAKWIGCRNMDHGIGTPARYLDCMEFFLAPFPPTGTFIENGNPALGADVINNSWGCPTDEGCYPQTVTQAIRVLRAAGIAFVSSVGNDGPNCSSAIDPPGLTTESFATGAFSENGSIAGFSSRGPVTVDGSNRPKPDMAAPGVGVQSTTRGGGYGSSSGTSMASPHVAGIVALLWAAAPALNGQVNATEAIIRNTAIQRNDNQCGTVANGRANHVWGWGEVDALAAVQAALGHGTISGVVRDAVTTQPLANAQVMVNGPGALNMTLTTNGAGAYSLTVGAGDYSLTASALGYQSSSATPTLTPNGAVVQDFNLQPATEFTVSGLVRQAGSLTPIRATVEVVGSSRRASTDASGSYNLSLPAGTFTLRAQAMGYSLGQQTVTITGHASVDFTLGLAPSILIVDDDEGNTFQQLYTNILTGLGRAYDVYEVRQTGAGPNADLMDNYCLVIWIVGEPRHRIRSSDYQHVQTYLDHGGRLLLSEPGGASSSFHANYLRASLDSSSIGLTLNGVGDFTGSYSYFSASETDPAGPLTATNGGQPAFAWSGRTTYAGVAFREAYQSLYLSFGLQNIGVSNRNAFLTQILDWFDCPNCRLPGDVDNSGRVDVVDITMIARAVGMVSTNPAYRRRLDRNLDGVINSIDVDVVAANWARVCP